MWLPRVRLRIWWARIAIAYLAMLLLEVKTLMDSSYIVSRRGAVRMQAPGRIGIFLISPSMAVTDES
jgi:hypothetical protein